MKKLEGKIAVITGASRGLGKAIADQFAREGASVVLSARSEADIQKNTADLREAGWQAACFACDVTDLDQVEALARFTIDKYGHFDIWINNAGMSGPYGATLDLSPRDFLAVQCTNMFGVYHGSMTAMRHFLPRKAGKLINLLGAGSKKPVPNQNAYGSTKAWIRVFTLALAAETRGRGVGVFALQPGLMETELLTEIVTFPAYEKRLRSFMPFLIRAAGKHPDVPARRALWLASPATDGRTGLVVSVGSQFSFLLGFLSQGLRQLFRRPGRKVELNVRVTPSAFRPLI